jgi:tRNA-uridine 2-sulfurtransferase
MTVAARRAAGPARAQLPQDPLDLVPPNAVVAVAMSGGVDSSVAAARCVGRGLRAVGITLAMWPRDAERDRDRGCCSVDAVEDARRVATTLGIPHYSWNLEPEFEAQVVSVFADEYAAGRTPNPCVHCNQTVKFGALLSRALQAGATHLATGHYARSGRRGQAVTLHRAAALAKDQAYTLHRLDQRQLRHAVFPLGSISSKEEVRRVAADLGLVTAAKPESQELCFVTGTVRSDLERRLAGRYRPGTLRDTDGNSIGEHRGVPFYTVGQRSGIAVTPTRPDAAPLYVVAVDAGSNTVTVGPRAALERTMVKLDDMHWIDAVAPPEAALTLQLRSHAAPAPVRVAAAEAGTLLLACDPPVTQVAPGQAGVLYDGDEVVGGGVVAS